MCVCQRENEEERNGKRGIERVRKIYNVEIRRERERERERERKRERKREGTELIEAKCRQYASFKNEDTNDCKKSRQ